MVMEELQKKIIKILKKKEIKNLIIKKFYDIKF